MAVNELLKGLGEIIKEVKEAKSVNEKIKILKESKICNHYYERLLNDVTYNLEKYYNLKSQE